MEGKDLVVGQMQGFSHSPETKSSIWGAKKDVSIVYGCYKNIRLGVKMVPGWWWAWLYLKKIHEKEHFRQHKPVDPHWADMFKMTWFQAFSAPKKQILIGPVLPLWIQAAPWLCFALNSCCRAC
eukprot:1151367-Pelagomonas_calceolata.AAC.4